MTIILRRPWTRQPRGAALADWANKTGTVIYTPFGVYGGQLIPPGSGSGGAIGVGKEGVCRTYGSSVSGEQLAHSSSISTNDFTIVGYVSYSSSGGYYSFLDSDKGQNRVFQFRRDTSNRLEYIGFNTSGTPYFATTSATVANNTPAVCVARVRGADIKVFIHGGTATGTISGSPNPYVGLLGMGASWAGASSEPDPISNDLDGNIWYCGVIPYAVPDAIIENLIRNPWQLFAPQTQRIWVPSAAAGVPTLTSIAASSITTTGAVLTVN